MVVYRPLIEPFGKSDGERVKINSWVAEAILPKETTVVIPCSVTLTAKKQNETTMFSLDENSNVLIIYWHNARYFR